MEQPTIVLTERVIIRLSRLVSILVQNGYFVYWENAEKYVDALEQFTLSIPAQTRRLCKNNSYGKWYCTYKVNRHTTWYFTFDTNEEYFVVRNVLNNHTREYPIYISV
jgi:hypothetical protein